ncbi:hypothetical protein IV203_013421 [Nitzschia inconspicua]|uniref:Uncharacterized protein n=1 Tax=Nitzschia inconspicua TaxID=303405 RepID=A0A9K3M8R7_9STRA|nr:hypothetical protein IV203_013421 [Nitzschia inconspicua]
MINVRNKLTSGICEGRSTTSLSDCHNGVIRPISFFFQHRQLSVVLFSSSCKTTLPKLSPAVYNTSYFSIRGCESPPQSLFARQFSSVVSETVSTTSSDKGSSTKGETKDNDNKKKKANASFFFDNLGKIFLLVIASIIASLIRSSAGTRNRNTLRDTLEDIALVDPVELEELRLANSALDPDTFRTILQNVYREFPNGTCSYTDFVHCVRRTMVQLKGDAFTVELGHLVDRLMVQVLNKQEKRGNSSDGSNYDNDRMPVSLFLTILTMALYSETKDRIRILYEVLQHQEEIQKHSDNNFGDSTDDTNNGNASTQYVSIDQVRSMVGYLQDSCQLPPDTQIIPTDTKYPTQQWKRGAPEELVPWQKGNNGENSDLIDLYTFATILRSKSVCAWGECYYKRKFDKEDV